jgi:RHS repeat-associated protein
MCSSSGTIVARYGYDPYGRTTLVSGSNIATKQFAGSYYHAASGLNLTLYRAYDSNTGRWLSRDPIAEGGGINLYDYVDDDPSNLTDPAGLCCKGCKELLATIISKAADLLDDIRRYDPVEDGKGGHPISPSKGGGVTVPGGHYKEINQRKAGLKDDIARYIKECIKKDQGPSGPCPKIPSGIDDMVNRPLPVPVMPQVSPSISPVIEKEGAAETTEEIIELIEAGWALNEATGG